MKNAPRIAVIHAVEGSLLPTREAFSQTFPEAELWNLLDDRLQTDATGGVTPDLEARMATLMALAHQGGADAILLACSLYGAVAEYERANLDIPVLTSDQALFDEVARRHPSSLVLVAAQSAAARDSADRLASHLAGRGMPDVAIRPCVANTGGKSGLPAVGIAGAVVSAARPLLDGASLLVLANFSLAPARQLVAEALAIPVLTPPHLAAQVLLEQLFEDGK